MTLLAVVVMSFGSEALSGAAQLALLVASAVSVAIGLLVHSMTWDDFEKAVENHISSISSVLLVLLLIGAVGGAWMVSGVVPTLIYYGMQIISPAWFLPSACLLCAVVSVMTGSSWTTIATIGIALMGIGKALGFDEGWIAGAIISGAYFGDKVSPLSDTTVLASGMVGVNIFTHIRYLLYTTLPAFTIAVLVFAIYGFAASGSLQMGAMSGFSDGLDKVFNLSLWLLLVPVITAWLIAKRMPAAVVLTISTIMGVVAAVIAQSHLVDAIAPQPGDEVISRFRGVMQMVYGSTRIETGVDDLDTLVATRGMGGMMSTVWLIFCSMTFGASMRASRMLDSISLVALKLCRGLFSTVASTTGMGLFMNIVCADQYLSITLTASMFGDVYKKMGLEPKLLSRTTEDAVTVTSVLIPWNSCGQTQSMVLGVPALTYLPYCFFNYLSPIVTLVVAAIGYRIKRTVTE